jgi:hypothetical protein
MAKAEQDPVTHDIGDVAVLLVVVELLHSLGLLQPVSDAARNSSRSAIVLATAAHRVSPGS